MNWLLDIEKRKKLTKATLVSDYVSMIEGSRMSQPFVVNAIHTEDILDFKAVAKKIYTEGEFWRKNLFE